MKNNMSVISANPSPFHLPHTETRQWGPHPSSVFTTFMPPLGHSLSTGHPFLYFVHLSHIYLLFSCTNTFYYQPLFLSSPLATCFPFWPHATHVTLGWSIPSHFPLLTSSISSEHDPGLLPLSYAFIYFVPPLAQLTSDLVVPMTHNLVPTVAATPYIIHPPTKGSLESSHFLASSMYLYHLIKSVDSTEYPFCS